MDSDNFATADMTIGYTHHCNLITLLLETWYYTSLKPFGLPCYYICASIHVDSTSSIFIISACCMLTSQTCDTCMSNFAHQTSTLLDDVTLHCSLDWYCISLAVTLAMLCSPLHLTSHCCLDNQDTICL